MKTFDEVRDMINNVRKEDELNEMVAVINKRRAVLRAKAIRKTSKVTFNFPERHTLAKLNGKPAEILTVKDEQCKMIIDGYEYWVTKHHLKEIKKGD
jgi:hypothetical protein